MWPPTVSPMNGIAIGSRLQEVLHAMDGCFDIAVRISSRAKMPAAFRRLLSQSIPLKTSLTSAPALTTGTPASHGIAINMFGTDLTRASDAPRIEQGCQCVSGLSPPLSGGGGRRFKSSHSDQLSHSNH
jgi:hypothetical protein